MSKISVKGSSVRSVSMYRGRMCWVCLVEREVMMGVVSVKEL